MKATVKLAHYRRYLTDATVGLASEYAGSMPDKLVTIYIMWSKEYARQISVNLHCVEQGISQTN